MLTAFMSIVKYHLFQGTIMTRAKEFTKEAETIYVDKNNKEVKLEETLIQVNNKSSMDNETLPGLGYVHNQKAVTCLYDSYKDIDEMDKSTLIFGGIANENKITTLTDSIKESNICIGCNSQSPSLSHLKGKFYHFDTVQDFYYVKDKLDILSHSNNVFVCYDRMSPLLANDNVTICYSKMTVNANSNSCIYDTITLGIDNVLGSKKASDIKEFVAISKQTNVVAAVIGYDSPELSKAVEGCLENQVQLYIHKDNQYVALGEFHDDIPEFMKFEKYRDYRDRIPEDAERATRFYNKKGPRNTRDPYGERRTFDSGYERRHDTY